MCAQYADKLLPKSSDNLDSVRTDYSSDCCEVVVYMTKRAPSKEIMEITSNVMLFLQWSNSPKFWLAPSLWRNY